MPKKAKSGTGTPHVIGVGMERTGTGVTEGDLVRSNEDRGSDRKARAPRRNPAPEAHRRRAGGERGVRAAHSSDPTSEGRLVSEEMPAERREERRSRSRSKEMRER